MLTFLELLKNINIIIIIMLNRYTVVYYTVLSISLYDTNFLFNLIIINFKTIFIFIN